MDQSDTFPQDVQELIGYLGPAQDRARVRAVPGEGTSVPVWILGSSLYGAQLAAHLGLPYAFASHFAPQMLDEAVRVYRELYQPSEAWPEPYFMLACNVFAGETDAEGRRLMTSMQQAFANLRSGRPGKLPRPVDDIRQVLDAGTLGMVGQALSVAAVGSPSSVKTALAEMIERFQPDEVIFTGQIHDHEARKRSFGIGTEAMRALG
jgi:luciferase family oxidoreductase group 1